MRRLFISLSDTHSHNGLVRVLVVEDETKLGNLLSRGLREEGYSADLAERGEEALWMAKAVEYDAILLDVMLPGLDGFDVCRRLRADGVWSPVLMLTARDAVDDRVTGLDAGADDYLAKPFAFPELLARVRALLRRTDSVLPSILRVADVELDPARFVVKRAGLIVPVTTKEFAILEYLMRHAGQLVTRAMLLESCWGASYEGLSNLVDVNLSRLRRKLDATGGTALVHTIRGAGVIFGERPA